MRMLRKTSQAALPNLTVASDISMAMIMIVIGVSLCGSAMAQSVKIQGLTIERTEKGFLVKGKIQATDLNKGGIVENDRVEIIADIKENANSQYPLLPVSQAFRQPDGAETFYRNGSGVGNTMTRLEYYGKDIKQQRIASLMLRKEPVWRAYGGLGEWEKNAPASVTQEYSGIIPLSYAGKTIRIRAALTHTVGGPYANWMGIGYAHDIGYSGILKGTDAKVDQPHEIKITWGPQGSANPAFPGQQIECIVNAQDSLGHELKYKWTALGAALGFNDPTLKRPTWTAQPNDTQDMAYWPIAVEVYCDHGASAKGNYIQKVRLGDQRDKAKALIMEHFNKIPHGPFEGKKMFGVIPPGASNNLVRAFMGWGKYIPVFWPSFDAMETQANKFEKYTCGSYQTSILDMLDKMRLHGTPAEKEVFKYWDYGPIMSKGTWHQVVVIYPKGGDWRVDGTVLDPWPTQKPEAMPLAKWMLNPLYIEAMPSDFWDGQYPLTGGKSYPTKAPPKPTAKQRRTSRLLSPEQKQHYGSLQDIRMKLDYLDKVGAEMEKVNPNIFRSIATGTKSPVQMLITDSAGRRSGWVDANTFVNEIPAAELTEYDEPDNTKGMLALLPLATYQVKITGRQTGLFSLLRAMPEEFTTAALADTAKITVVPSDTFTYILSPDEPMTKLIKPGVAAIPFTDMVPGTSIGTGLQQLHPVADASVYAYAYQNWNKSNQGAYDKLGAGWNPAGGEKRAYLKFNLPPGNANSFTKATLRLFHNHTGGSNALPLEVHGVIAPWQEGNDTYHSGQAERPATNGEITWVNQPAFNQAPVARFKLGTPNSHVDIDITPLVKAWLTGKPNHGLVLTPMGSPNARTPESAYGFYSREDKEKSRQPVLIISSSTPPLQTPPGTGTTGSTGQVIPNSPPTVITQPNPNAPTGLGHVGHQHTGHNPAVVNPTGQEGKPVLLLSEDFSKGAGKWNVNGQAPTIRDGRAYFVAGNNRTLGTDLRLPIEDFAIEFDAYGDGEMLNVLVANEKLKLYAASMRRTKTLFIAHGPENTKEFPAVYKPGKWHHYRFVRFGDQMELFLDGKRVAHQTFARPLEGPALLGFGGLQSTIGLDNIQFYDLSNIPRIGTAFTPRIPNITEPSIPEGVDGNQPHTHDSPLLQPIRPLRRFRPR